MRQRIRFEGDNNADMVKGMAFEYNNIPVALRYLKRETEQCG